MAPLILSIQTASPAGSLALTTGRQLLAELNLDVRQTPTEWLLPSIETLLGRAERRKQDLDAIAVVCGPGSFTGLRVGLATAKGLALAIGCPLLGVSSLQCLAMQLPFAVHPVCVMLDARKQEVYTARYAWQKGFPERLSVETVMRPDRLLDDLAEEILFVGSGAAVYRSLIVRRMAGRAHFAPDFLNLPRASAAAALALHAWESGQHFSADELMSNYLRPSEAELNLGNEKKSGNSG